MDDFSGLSTEQLEDEITTWAGHIAAAEARFLALVGEFDAREGWAGVGLVSCAHWLTWRVGLGPVAARERVRVARALRSLPLLRAAFGAGRVSWSQVRAVTRVASAESEATYLECARHATAAQLERLCRGVRRARRLAADPEDAEGRHRVDVRYDEDGSLVITTRLPAEDGAVVLAALDRALSTLHHSAADTPDGTHTGPAHPAGGGTPAVSAETSEPSAETAEPSPLPPGGLPRARAEGLVELAESYLDGDRVDRPASDRHLVVLHVHEDSLTSPAALIGHLDDGELLPAPVVSTRHCDTSFRTLRRRGGSALDLGRRQREPSAAQRQALGALDGERCRFPGCPRRRRLHAHHLHWWSRGGRTDLANLVLLCPRHHTLVHAAGFALQMDTDRTLRVHTRHGRAVPAAPATPVGDPLALPSLTRVAVGPDTLPPDWFGDGLDLGYAVAVLLQEPDRPTPTPTPVPASAA